VPFPSEIPLFQVDAFASRRFAGNPAAVCPLPGWPDDALLQAIAAENNLSETAFLVRETAGWRIRWFTPQAEVDLCGHATLAAAFVLFERLEPGRMEVEFASQSGPLGVRREADRLALDFPARPPRPIPPLPALSTALGRAPAELLRARDLCAVYSTEADVRSLRPDFAALTPLGDVGIIATAPGDDCDFVSRFFAPAVGIPEDPVTGSAHATLTPYWAARLGKRSLFARQVSARGGELWVEDRGERVAIAGCAVLVVEGRMLLG
jgi:predicted PhzF superfamily epimerase YddE/YHI9